MVAENLLDPEEMAKPDVDQLDLEKPDEDKVFDIQIDRMHYEVTQTRITGADLRNVPTPPIPSDRDLFEVILGRPDRKVESEDRIPGPRWPAVLHRTQHHQSRQRTEWLLDKGVRCHDSA